MENSEGNQKTGHYYLPEMMTYFYCFACLAIVLESSEEVKNKYDEVKKCWELQGCKSFINGLEKKVQDRNEIVNKVLSAAGIDPREDNTMKLGKTQDLISGLKNVISDYAYIEKIQLVFHPSKKKDLNELVKRIDELIKIGFNRESDKSRGVYKLTSKTSKKLAETVCLYSLYEVKKIDLMALTKLPAVIQRKNVYTFADLINNRATRRLYYKLVGEYQNAGFRLKSELTIAQRAIMWYKSRVVYSGPKEFCDQALLKNEGDFDPANVSHQIEDVDEAIGYPRGN